MKANDGQANLILLDSAAAGMELCGADGSGDRGKVEHLAH